MFSRFFKPKWQHPKARVRLKALASLSGEISEQRTILEALARDDADAEVRQAARQRLAQVDQGKKARGDRAESVQSQAAPATVLDHLLDHADEATRLAALDQIDDEAQLEEIALHHAQARVRALAVERIGDPDRLQRIARDLRGRDKRAFKIARTKLAGMRAEIEARAAQRQLAEELCDGIESLARTDFSPLYGPKLRGLERQWQSLDEAIAAEFASRYQPALNHCRKVMEEHDAAMADLEAQSLAQRQIDGCCQSLESKIEQLRGEPDLSDAGLAALAALLEQQQHHWQHASAAIDRDSAESRRFNRAWQHLTTYSVAARLVREHEETLTEALSQARALSIPDDIKKLDSLSKRLTKLLAKIAWPDNFKPPEPLAQAEEAQALLAQKQEALGAWQAAQGPRLESVLEELGEAIEAGKLKRSERLFKKARQLMAALPPERTRRHHGRFVQLKANIQELRDWRGFAGVQHKEDLCRRMEALIELEIDADEKEVLIQRLQEEWKQLGPTGPERSEELWQRFRQASERAWAPCRELHQRQAEARRHNLAKRQEICSQLETYLEQNDWEQADWPAVEKVIEVAKAEWRAHSPVDRKPGKALHQEFDRLIKALRAKLQSEYDRNIAHKERLVGQAQKLIAYEDVAEAVTLAKQLQHEWQAVGVTPRRANQKLWRQFRGACDEIFARRDEARQAHQVEKTRDRTRAEALCDEIEALATLSDRELPASRERYQESVAQFRALASLPAALHKRFDQACSRYQKQLSGLGHRLALARIEEALRRIDLCEQLELAILKGGEAPAAEVYQDRSEVTLPESLDQALAGRLAQARADLDSGDDSRLRALQEQALAARQLLAIRAEILAGLDSPAEAREARMAYQLEQLNLGLGHAGEEGENIDQQALALVEEWLQWPALESDPEGRLLARFKAALSALS